MSRGIRKAVGITLLGVGLVVTSAARGDARFDYLLYCAGCHLENGRGAPPEVPDLTADLAHFATYPEGRAYVARVPGSAQAPISDERLAALLNWMVEHFTDLDPPAPLFEAETVGQDRAEPLSDPLQFRARLVKPLDPPPDRD